MAVKKLLPPEVKAAVIDVCGRCFWYKQPLFDMFARAGISESSFLQYEHEPKFKIARQLLSDLESQGDDGFLLQKRLVTELCRLRNLPDSEVPDKDAGLDALRKLKRIALDNDLAVAEDHQGARRRKQDADLQVQKARERERRLSELSGAYAAMQTSTDPQARGYELEDLFKELFALFEIRYRKSYKADGEQIDGFFTYAGFDYIVEDRWRKDQPSLQDLQAFKGKVDRKIESTRGLFVSVVGFDGDVIRRLRETGPANIILMDGYDLALVLEGRVHLIDALQAKVDKAAQEGSIYFQLAELFR